ncbi:UDP-galactose 4-epimerase [Microbacterium testaceum StLB037]|uniref:UDP-glucose 4-epimerase n=1 Tax=Microbacterium testaceum (strain StLB037) TaxID=979556 RepID=A0A1H0QHP1_MICTS|nr:UDP-glucose 4-epimerase GalE [Microbacterium testaceum]SDP16730.1 UDP-galactose 4-epimerase [Microbacterium testaceum StLB037]
MTWLVTGGAGYIGAHVVSALQAAGLDPVVLDDLSTGKREFVPSDVDFVQGNILDTALVEETLRGTIAEGVIHVAGYKYAGESVTRPLHAYAQNVDGTRSVLEAMRRAGVAQIVFSSSAAVYGTPDVPTVTEYTPKKPTTPYGESKLIGEWLLRDVAEATRSEPRPLRHTSLRYFNVVGSGRPDVYDSSPFNLFPIAFRALTARRTPSIYGVDYATPDGTAVRDYVHVSDIAAAHAVAAQRLSAGDSLQPAYNLGSGMGISVREIMSALRMFTGIDFDATVEARRAGDPDRIVASGVAAARDLNWAMRHSIQQMVQSGWKAHLRQLGEAV